MNFASLSKNWPGQSRNSTMRLLRRLRRQARLFKLKLGQNLDQIRSRDEWSGWFRPANPLSRITLSRVTVGRLAQIDRTAQVSASLGSLIRLGEAVQLGRQTQLSAHQKGEIILESAVSLGQGTEITAQAGYVEIGSATSLGPLCCLSSTATLKIGRNCQLGSQVTLYAQSALGSQSGPSIDSGSLGGGSSESASVGAGSIVIEDHCWIGNNVQILAGVTIGQHSVISDDAVIVSDVPAFSVAAGSPAKTRNGALREVVADLSAHDDYTTLSQLALKSYLNQLNSPTEPATDEA